MAKRPYRAPSDRPAAWAVIALLMLGASTISYMFAPLLAQTVKGETIFMLFVLAAVVAGAGVITLCTSLLLGWKAARASPRGSVKQYLRQLRVPLAIVLLAAVLSSLLSEQMRTIWASGAARACAAVLAGWFAARGGYSIWKCAVAGVLLMVVDHVVVKTFAFGLTGEWLAIGGVFLSFAMFAVVPMALAAAGGFLATRIPPANSTVETDAHEAARSSP